MNKKRKLYLYESQNEKRCDEIIRATNDVIIELSDGNCLVKIHHNHDTLRPVLLAMIVAIGKVYGQSVSKQQAENLLDYAYATHIGMIANGKCEQFIKLGCHSIMQGPTLAETIGDICEGYFHGKKCLEGLTIKGL